MQNRPSHPLNQKARLVTQIPGPKSQAIRAREDAHLAPGLQGFALMAGIVVEKAEGSAVTDVDVVVVGAGPAGACAALVAARAGLDVVLLERGPFPGSKNMYGGVVYPRILDDLIPEWWLEAPVQRWVTRRSTMLLTDTQALTVDFRS